MNQTNAILDVFQEFRMAPTAIDQYEQAGKELLRQKIQSFVVAGEPLRFVMLGYPMKSPNFRDKVLGVLPDLAEQVSLQNFSRFADRIKEVYAPGANVTIVSDGYVFSDVLQVKDGIVAAYEEVVRDMSKDFPITIYNAGEFYSKRFSIATVREKIITQFGVTDAELERRILMQPDTNMLYRGMIKFMTGDLAIRDFISNSQLHKNAKIVARQMMVRNEAYGNLVSVEFADHIRLSMHPTVNNGKYSFQLIPSPKAWTSPWHAALVVGKDGMYETIHRKDAQQRELELVYADGRPFYFKEH